MTKEEAIGFCRNNPEAATEIILMVEKLKNNSCSEKRIKVTVDMVVGRCMVTNP